MHASDIQLASGLKLISSPETLILTCSLVAAAVSAEDADAEAEEGPAAPEVIGEKKPEDSEGQTE